MIVLTGHTTLLALQIPKVHMLFQQITLVRPLGYDKLWVLFDFIVQKCMNTYFPFP